MEQINLEKTEESILFDIKEDSELLLLPACLENTSIKRKIEFNFLVSDVVCKIVFRCLAKENVELDLTLKLFSQKEDIEGVEAYLEIDILTLSNNNISVKPFLEIPQKDIKFEHKVSIGSINEDWLTYLMSKGLSEDNATDLITKKFL